MCSFCAIGFMVIGTGGVIAGDFCLLISFRVCSSRICLFLIPCVLGLLGEWLSLQELPPHGRFEEVLKGENPSPCFTLNNEYFLVEF